MRKRTMRVAGIDLAGSDRNDTGFCALSGDGREKSVRTRLLKTDSDIELQCDLLSPDLIAIDAPLSPAKNACMRGADEQLREYGALPHNLRGMACLVERGIALGNRLRASHPVIEVFSTATAKILGFYDKDDAEMQKRLAPLLGGDLTGRMLSRDELDAVAAALTAFLHLRGKTAELGDAEGKIAVPKV